MFSGSLTCQGEIVEMPLDGAQKWYKYVMYTLNFSEQSTNKGTTLFGSLGTKENFRSSDQFSVGSTFSQSNCRLNKSECMLFSPNDGISVRSVSTHPNESLFFALDRRINSCALERVGSSAMGS